MYGRYAMGKMILIFNKVFLVISIIVSFFYLIDAIIGTINTYAHYKKDKENQELSSSFYSWLWHVIFIYQLFIICIIIGDLKNGLLLFAFIVLTKYNLGYLYTKNSFYLIHTVVLRSLYHFKEITCKKE